MLILLAHHVSIWRPKPATQKRPSEAQGHVLQLGPNLLSLSKRWRFGWYLICSDKVLMSRLQCWSGEYWLAETHSGSWLRYAYINEAIKRERCDQIHLLGFLEFSLFSLNQKSLCSVILWSLSAKVKLCNSECVYYDLRVIGGFVYSL